MNKLFKDLALFVAVTCVVWVAVLWRWETTARDMNTRDIVIYLGLLPLTVFGLALLLRWAWRGAGRQQEARAAAPAAGAAAASGQTSTGADDARRQATVQLLASHLVCAAGASAAELVQAAHDGKPRPGLDAELRDATGLPVFTARIEALDANALQAQLETHVAATRATRPEWATLAPPEHVQRALAALQEPLIGAVAALEPWAARFEPAPDATRGQPPDRRVRVLLGWPADWSAFEQELGTAIANEWLTAQSATPISAACFALTAHACSGEDLMLHADRLLQTLAREGRDEPVIVAASHSTIGEAAVAGLESDGLLFSAQTRPKGRMPGEAAAALLFAGALWPIEPGADQPAQHMHRPAVLRRDKSIDAPGRVSSEIALQAMTQAVAASGLAAESVAALACDADQHSPRSGEFYGAGLGLLPHLDSGEDMRLIGTVTGAVGAVSALLVVACAAERAKDADKPCLAVTLGDSFARLAVLVLPGAPQPKGGASPSPAAGAAA
jgi:hypothetical protein